jgi:hypothetical protein
MTAPSALAIVLPAGYDLAGHYKLPVFTGT